MLYLVLKVLGIAKIVSYVWGTRPLFPECWGKEMSRPCLLYHFKRYCGKPVGQVGQGEPRKALEVGKKVCRQQGPRRPAPLNFPTQQEEKENDQTAKALE